MRYLFTIEYVPGKILQAADALSRINLNQPEASDTELAIEASFYLGTIMKNIPISEKRLKDIKLETELDEVSQKLMTYIQNGWPEKYEVNHLVRPYWEAKADITAENGILLYGTRLIIPCKMRLDVLDKIHEGHQGIQKCRERAKQSVWWPGISRHIQEMVEQCSTCAYQRRQHAQPLIPTEFPERPFQMVGVDLFELRKKNYLILVDYFSRFPIVKLLSSTTSNMVIEQLKSSFAQHGIPEFLRSDNGPQFVSTQFKEFTKNWYISHQTSSPRFAQSNGEVERCVQTVKNLISKSKDPYLALLAYRTTPLANGEAPCQLLMGRMLRSTIPVHPICLNPKYKVPDSVWHKEDKIREREKFYFDKRHSTKDLRPLIPGEKVYVPDMDTEAEVYEKVQTRPRSYGLRTPKGIIQRNRYHVRPIPKSSEDPEAGIKPVEPLAETGSRVTSRYGRPINPPQRYDPDV